MFELTPDDAREVFQAVERQSGTDLSGFALASFRLRLLNLLHNYSLDSVQALIARLKEEPAFFEIFMRDISVGSPDMFRDPDFWIHLREEILPALLKARLHPEVVLPESVTGNELYSLIVLLRESGEESRVDLAATCRNKAILDQIRSGRFSTGRYKNSTENYKFFNPGSSLDAYFETRHGKMNFKADLLDGVKFRVQFPSRQAFHRQTAMVLYRNRMLYMNREAQEKRLKEILGGMPEGCLFVTGTGEEIRGLGYDRLLSVVSADLKIYARTGEN